VRLCRTHKAAASRTNPTSGRTPTARSCPTSFPLTEHVQASPRLIEQAIAREASLGSQENDVIVLDNIIPPFVKATAALNACDCQFLPSPSTPCSIPGPEYDPGNLDWSQSALSIISA